MARGTATLYNQTQLDAYSGVHDLSSDTLKIAFVTATAAPAVDDVTPTWSDYSANEVSTAGGYPAGGITLTTVAIALVSGVATLTADDIALAMDALGFTDAAYAILVNTSAASSECIGFWDLDGPVSEQAGPVSMEFPAGVVAEFPANVAA